VVLGSHFGQQTEEQNDSLRGFPQPFLQFPEWRLFFETFALLGRYAAWIVYKLLTFRYQLVVPIRL